MNGIVDFEKIIASKQSQIQELEKKIQQLEKENRELGEIIENLYEGFKTLKREVEFAFFDFEKLLK